MRQTRIFADLSLAGAKPDWQEPAQMHCVDPGLWYVDE